MKNMLTSDIPRRLIERLRNSAAEDIGKALSYAAWRVEEVEVPLAMA